VVKNFDAVEIKTHFSELIYGNLGNRAQPLGTGECKGKTYSINQTNFLVGTGWGAQGLTGQLRRFTLTLWLPSANRRPSQA
jgi:hypothetical protein